MPTYTIVLNTINAFVVIVGVPSLTAALIYIGRQFQKLDALITTMEAVKHNVNLCTFALIKMNKIDGNRVQAFSPAKLSPAGYRYLARIGIKAVVDHETHRRTLFGRIDRAEPRSKYDADVLATQIAFEALTDTTPMMHEVKVYLYNHPTENIANVAYLAGLYLRDQYLCAHPELVE